MVRRMYRCTRLGYRMVFLLLAGLATQACGARGAPREIPPPRGTEVSQEGNVLIARSDLLSDLRELRRVLETSHPDPYLRSGGVVSFRRRFSDAEELVPKEGMTATSFYRLVRPLVAQIGDGHTVVLPPRDSKPAERIWLELEVIERSLVVRAVYREDARRYLGAVVQAVEGIPVETLLARMGSRYGHDNDVQNLQLVAKSLRWSWITADMLDRDAVGTSVRFTVVRSDGVVDDLTAARQVLPPGPAMEPETGIALPEADTAGMASGFVGLGADVAYLRVDSSMAYREAFETWQNIGPKDLLGTHLDEAFRKATGSAPVGSVADRIAALPSFVEHMERLSSRMKEKQTTTLVVDVRKNDGGSGLFVRALEYFLFPVESTIGEMDGYAIQRYSELYFSSSPTETLADVRARTSPTLALGDFDFAEERRYHAAHGGPLSPAARLEALTSYEREVHWSKTLTRAYEEHKWNAHWTPAKLFVLTSAATYSAGFDAVLAMRRHGARVVGTASGQAANCFISALFFELSHSHINGQLSSKWSVALPEDPANGILLQPDHELTYARLSEMNFDQNAALRMAIEARGSGSKIVVRKP
jgi:hypothetical protein